MRTRTVTAVLLGLAVLTMLAAGNAPASESAPVAESGEDLAAAGEPSGDVGAEPHEGGGAHGHADGPPKLNPLESFKADMALWTGVVFVLLFLVLGKFAWGPIADSLDKREQRIAGEIAAAEKAHADAKAQLAEYEQRLAAAESEIRGMIDKGKRDAEHAGEQIVRKARDEAEAEKRRAIEEIELASAAAMKELAEQSANLAVDLAGRIVRSKLSPSDHSALIEEAVANFSKLQPGKN